jgi:hypothetical protein
MVRIGSIQKYLLLILVMVFTGACGTSTSVTKPDSQILTPDSEFKIALWTDHKDNVYRAGEDIYINFIANRDCYLTLIDIGSDGRVKILLPNQYQKDNLAKAGYVYRIPSQSAKFTFKANEPPSEEIIKAIATLEDVNLYDQKDVRGGGTFQEFVYGADTVERGIGIKLKPVDTKRWTDYQMTIKIEK